MTTYWAVVYEHSGLAVAGYLYRTEQDAKNAIRFPARIAVPIEVPEPPHVWDIGDWFHIADQSASRGYYLIVAPDIPGHWYVVVFGPSGGAWVLEEYDPDYTGVVPCDPPQWFTDLNEAT